MCFDQDLGDYKIGGDKAARSYSELQIYFTPCNYVNEELGLKP